MDTDENLERGDEPRPEHADPYGLRAALVDIARSPAADADADAAIKRGDAIAAARRLLRDAEAARDAAEAAIVRACAELQLLGVRP